jgi:hypothetical protein
MELPMLTAERDFFQSGHEEVLFYKPVQGGNYDSEPKICLDKIRLLITHAFKFKFLLL